MATDLVPEMLQVARQLASERGLSNIEFQTADAEHLPFPDQCLDHTTCRFGLLFFSDVRKALSEQCRVMRPNGLVYFLVWGPADENPVFATVLGAFLKHVPVPPPPPDAPSVYRFADETKLADTIRSAGFREVQTREVKIDWAWPGPPQEAWLATKELAAPFKKIIAALPSEKLDDVERLPVL